MKKAEVVNGQREEIRIPAYGRKKLLGYADSFRDLARTFTYKTEKEKDEENDRQNQILKSRLVENREILAGHLNEIADMMKTLAEEKYQAYPLREKEMKRIVRECREGGIFIRNIYYTEDPVEGTKLAVTMKGDEKSILTVEEAGDFLSVLLEKQFLPEQNGLFFLSGEYETVLFEEAASYDILTGVAKATRENETVSGDTCAVIERGNGGRILALSDGMGSGEKALADSERVIDLLEKFMEAGFSKERAVEMINGVLLAREEEGNMSTLDICDINLYTAQCELMKIGSSYTYIKRGQQVEQLEADTLPLGIFHKYELDCPKRQLQDGDYIIMISDGILDGVDDDALLREVIAGTEIRNPQEMANYLLQFVLHKTGGRVYDDMSILVAGIWKS